MWFWADYILETIDLFKALADETRLRLVNVLGAHELNVNELVRVLEMGQSRISRHLQILAAAGLVHPRRDGLKVYYSLRREEPGRELIQAALHLTRDGEVFTNDLARAASVIEERRQATRKFFESIAGDWDRLRSEVLGGFDLAAEVAARMPQCRVAVDLGCGTGRMLPSLLARAQEVIGVDSSQSMLRLARERLGEKSRSVSLRIGELEHLPLRDGEADFAVCSLALHHLSHPKAGLQEAARVLGPQGGMMVVEFDKHRYEPMRSQYGDQWLGFNAEEIAGWLRDSGFQPQSPACFPVNHGLTVQIINAHKQPQ